MTETTPSAPTTPPVRCSDVAPEPLPGTAKQAHVYVVFEWPSKWSHDVLDGDTFGEELTAKLKKHLGKFGATLQLIRHPTREGRNIADHHLYLVFADEAIIEVAHIDAPEEILDLDLSGPGKNDAHGMKPRHRPLLLVCTHGKRDVCCALKGRPVVTELERRYPFDEHGDIVWETSHTKGHRFAPSMLLMPWGYSFGRMNVEATEAMVESSLSKEFFIPGNRGRGTLSTQGQVAELAVANKLATAGETVCYGQLDVVEETIVEAASMATVTVRDTRGDDHTDYTVVVEMQTVDGIIASCGAEPKSGDVWEAVRVEKN